MGQDEVTVTSGLRAGVGGGVYAHDEESKLLNDDDDDDVYYYIRWRLKLEHLMMMMFITIFAGD